MTNLFKVDTPYYSEKTLGSRQKHAPNDKEYTGNDEKDVSCILKYDTIKLYEVDSQSVM